MKATIQKGEKQFVVDLSAPVDLSILLKSGTSNLTAWYAGPPLMKAVEQEGFVGDVSRGGSVNFRDVFFNPHAHGTHTECVGHISARGETISEALKDFFFLCRVVTVEPDVMENGDRVITLSQLEELLPDNEAEAIAVRTLPNDPKKKSRQYSNTNPPYIEREVMPYLLQKGIKHFLIDLPSVDREEDGGALLAHNAFWEFPEKGETGRTITEFIFVPDSVKDGLYFMNLQVANFDNDAAPSRPVIYPIIA